MKLAQRQDPQSVQGRIYQNLTRWISIRMEHDMFAGSEMSVIDTGNEHVLGYVRYHGTNRVLIFANFSEQEQNIPANLLRMYGLGYEFTDLFTGLPVEMKDRMLAAYEFLCLMA